MLKGQGTTALTHQKSHFHLCLRVYGSDYEKAKQDVINISENLHQLRNVPITKNSDRNQPVINQIDLFNINSDVICDWYVAGKAKEEKVTT